MAKRQVKVLPARPDPEAGDENSVLRRSAESLARVLRSLRRQVEGATPGRRTSTGTRSRAKAQAKSPKTAAADGRSVRTSSRAKRAPRTAKKR